MVYDVDIEFGHIYVNNNNFLKSHKSSELLGHLLNDNNDSYKIRTSLLVDDYYKTCVFNIKEYLDGLTIRPDNVVLESHLCNYAEQILNQIKTVSMYYRKENKTVVFFGDIALKQVYHSTGKIKYNCPILTMSWYLLRLGAIENTIFLPSKKIINILDEKFRNNENNVLKLIENSPYYNYRNCIENIYY